MNEESSFDQPKPLTTTITQIDQTGSEFQVARDTIFDAIKKGGRMVTLAKETSAHFFAARHPDTQQIIGLLSLDPDGMVELIVDPQFQRQTVGAQLLSHAIDFATNKTSLPTLTAIVRPLNPASPELSPEEKLLIRQNFKPTLTETSEAELVRRQYELNLRSQK